jgi:hypothetical protein
MRQPEMVIFTRTFDLLAWLLPATNHFPRAHRHDFTRRLLDAAFDLRERLEEANLRKGTARRERLERADEALVRLKVYVRLAVQLGWLNAGQYQHVAAVEAGEVELGKFNAAVRGWVEHVRHGDTMGLRKAILGSVRLKPPPPERK